MALTNVFLDSYGWTVQTTIIEDGNPLPCTWVTAVTVEVKDPSGNVADITATCTPTWADQAGGVFRWTVPQGLLDETGAWAYQLTLSATGIVIPCAVVNFTVQANIQ